MLIAAPNEDAAVTESSALLLPKPALSSHFQYKERESHRHTVAMQPGKDQWDALSRSGSVVFSIVQPFKRSQLSTLVTLQQYPLWQPPEMKDVLHNTSANLYQPQFTDREEGTNTGRPQPLDDSV